ncbi:MAG: hypothetical protein MHM6MM_006692, partial [Cercozoa sp. M6MM]
MHERRARSHTLPGSGPPARFLWPQASDDDDMHFVDEILQELRQMVRQHRPQHPLLYMRDWLSNRAAIELDAKRRRQSPNDDALDEEERRSLHVQALASPPRVPPITEKAVLPHELRRDTVLPPEV